MDTCFQTEKIINIDTGTEGNEVNVQNIPDDKLFAIEFIGINGFTTKEVDIYIALDVDTKIYPITVSGSVPFNDPTYSWRIFGSQQVRIYVKPGQRLNIHAYRKDINVAARIFAALSGVLIDVVTPVGPGNVTIE